MEIQEIKNRLTLAQVLHYYHLKPDKQLRLNCPFHNDKTPSMQVYYKTHTAYCFSSNCKTHGKSLDVIDFIMHKENLTKREAILKAQSMISGATTPTKPPTEEPARKVYAEPSRRTVLTQLFTYFKNAIHNSKPAQEYLQSRCLDFTKTEVGYNSGQFHHGSRRDKQLIQSCIKLGLLLDLGTKSRTGNPAYKPFGKWGIVFALRNKSNEIVSLYFRSTLGKKEQRHFYLRNRQGLYPKYPSAATRRLILTESIIDAASLLEQEKIKAHYEVLALFGTNGFTDEHTEAVSQLKELEEIIFFLDGDDAGNKAVEKYAPMLKALKSRPHSGLKADYPSVTISNVQVPENEDVNSLLQGHSGDILHHLVNTRKEYDFLFSSGEPPQADIFLSTEEKTTEEIPVENKKAEAVKTRLTDGQAGLDTNVSTGLNASNPYNLKYRGNAAQYQIKGFKVEQLDSLKITLQITIQ